MSLDPLLSPPSACLQASPYQAYILKRLRCMTTMTAGEEGEEDDGGAGEEVSGVGEEASPCPTTRHFHNAILTHRRKLDPPRPLPEIIFGDSEAAQVETITTLCPPPHR